MRDGAAERGQLGLFLVDMNELVVASRIGELVDHFLRNGHPIGCPHLLANMRRKITRLLNIKHVMVLHQKITAPVMHPRHCEPPWAKQSRCS